jgi:hypothetical protein
LLLDGYKFDLRVYVLVVGIDPIQAFVCEEGLARFCTVSIFEVHNFCKGKIRSAYKIKLQKGLHASDELLNQQDE